AARAVVVAGRIIDELRPSWSGVTFYGHIAVVDAVGMFIKEDPHPARRGIGDVRAPAIDPERWRSQPRAIKGVRLTVIPQCNVHRDAANARNSTAWSSNGAPVSRAFVDSGRLSVRGERREPGVEELVDVGVVGV